ncbi:hypothetical protein K491DRAFT_723552 [Lophiostoma macrostomum CBS 122681]|uniref:C3H1-type domain-containing protein n=1 Tax=Lophiostoma macrostomum CBS 122681 TaxID=1314788 RepID=A0A6A6SMB3_9PLEO|nr:hypothetical protein K491DRAFT_723552 [Lophiostoma macrostomum CBS 122681]
MAPTGGGGDTKKKWCRLVNTAGGCKRRNCPYSHDHKGKQCHSFARSGKCDYGDTCVFLHGDAQPRGSNPTRVSATKPDDSNVPKSISKPNNDQGGRVRRWRFLTTENSSLNKPLAKHQQNRFFQDAF